MKYVIQVFQDGKLVTSKTSKKDYSWSFIDKTYTKMIGDYKSRGYKSVSSCDEYNLLFNEEKKVSTVFSMKMYTVSDFKDSNGDPIILEKKYTGKPWFPDQPTGRDYDLYEINPGCFIKSLYLRNITRCDRYTIVDPNCNAVFAYGKTVGDISGSKLTQELIDSLELKPFKTSNK